MSVISPPVALNYPLRLVNDRLSSFTTNVEFDDRLILTFGNTIDTQFYRELWNSPDFALESVIEIRSSSELNGANGAFSRDTGKIYLAEEYLQPFPPSQDGLAASKGAIDNIVSLILEEYGHLIDAQVNPVETVGDEGAIFALLVQGETITTQQLETLQSEDDTASIVLNGQTILIEQITLTQDPGNRPGDAYDVGLLNTSQSFSQTVSPTDTDDYYRFSLNDFSQVSISLTESIGNANLFIVQDVNNNGISDSGETIYNVGFSDGVTVNLNSGTYFVAVLSGSSNATNYDLNLSGSAINNPNPPTNPGNTPREAYDVGLLNTSQSFSQTVSPTDTDDYYRFSLNDFSQVSISLTESTGNANLFIVQDVNNNGISDSGETIYNVGFSDGVTVNLNSGTYFVAVLSGSSNATNYDLNLSGSAINNPNPPTNPGNTPREAYDVGLLNTSQSFNQTVSPTDTDDYYRFSLNDFSQVSISLTESTGNANLFIVQDVNNNGISDSGETIYNVGFSDGVTVNLNSGTYFVAVLSGSSNATNYDLNLSGRVINNLNPPTNPGNTPREAYNLGILNTPQNISQTVTQIDTDDYYQFTLYYSSQVSLSLTESTGNANLFIVQDVNNNGISDSGETIYNVGFSDQGVVNLDSGTYFLAVLSGSSNATNYDLNLSGIALNNNLTLVQGTAQIAYVAYYGRPADPGGLDYWNGRLGDERINYSPRSGENLTDSELNVYNELVSGFGNVEEANRIFDSLNNRQKVNQVYQFAFNRDGDSGGLDYWTNQIDRGFVNLTTFALEVALGAQNQDFQVLANKIESADLFSRGVETNPDGSAYSGSRGEIFGRDWLAGYGNTVATIANVDTALSELNS